MILLYTIINTFQSTLAIHYIGSYYFHSLDGHNSWKEATEKHLLYNNSENIISLCSTRDIYIYITSVEQV